MATQDEVLTVYDVAEWAKVSVRTVWRWEADGRLPSVRIDGIVRFRRADVDTLLTPKAAS